MQLAPNVTKSLELRTWNLKLQLNRMGISMKKMGLGRGLDALLPETNDLDNMVSMR